MVIPLEFRSTSLLVFLIIVLSGCIGKIQSDGETVATFGPTTTSSVRQEGLVTYTPELSKVELIPTSTIVILAAENPTPPITPVLPAPTLTSRDKVASLTELMRNRKDCELPCWWSISPGESSIKATQAMLEAHGFLLGEDNIARLRAGNVVVTLDFEGETETIQSILVHSEDMSALSDAQPFVFSELWQQYDVASLLDAYGQPSRAFVFHPFQFDAGQGPAFNMAILYDDRGIAVEYLGPAEYLGDNQYRACLDIRDIAVIDLLLYQPGTKENVIEDLIPPDSVSHIGEPGTVYESISWGQATSSSLDSLRDVLGASDAAYCFEFTSQ